MKSFGCRACGSTVLNLVYDFGLQPLAGHFPTLPESTESAARYPLDLTQCSECGLMQVTQIPPIEEVFNDDYRYASSTIPDLVDHFSEYANVLSTYLHSDSRVLEFGCNDGVLLARLEAHGFRCTGVDASNNIAELARAKGLSVMTGFLTPKFVLDNELVACFELVTCSNVFAHIDDISETIEAVRLALKPGGYFSIEVHDGELLESETQFDTIYHEHLTYFTESSLRRFVELQGFEFHGCQKIKMHGGSLRLMCRLLSPYQSKSDATKPRIVNGKLFSDTIERCSRDLHLLSEKYGPLDGYGAAGRSQMFVNVTRTASCFSKIFDDSPLRQERYLVGGDIPITAYRKRKGKVCVILAWNYAPAIFERIRGEYEKVYTILPELTLWAGKGAKD
jgi:SAM-dependent methyltransferase